MNPPLNVILIYARDMRATAQFYQTHFGFSGSGEIVDGLIELTSSGGASLLIHQAAKSVKLGHAGIKLMFDVADIDAFKARCLPSGLAFGSTHIADGYAFANAKDPDGNSVAISSRAYRKI